MALMLMLEINGLGAQRYENQLNVIGVKMENDQYQVTSRRVVPINAVSHAGMIGVCVKLCDGFIAWGFGADFDDAEKAAVKKALELRGISKRII